jgi:hypothetical protein
MRFSPFLSLCRRCYGSDDDSAESGGSRQDHYDAIAVDGD